MVEGSDCVNKNDPYVPAGADPAFTAERTDVVPVSGPSALLTSVRSRLPSGSAHMTNDGRVLRWNVHRLTVSIDNRLSDTPEGPAHILDSRIALAKNVSDAQYLALLALYMRRLDPMGTLVHTSDRTVHSHSRFLIFKHQPIDERDEILRSILVAQALVAETLIWQAMVAGILTSDDVTPSENADMDRPERPDTLLSAGADLGRRGMRVLSQVLLEGSSKLGPWFVGTTQDAMLTQRIDAGWTREANEHNNGVRLLAPQHSRQPLHAVQIDWAHHSEVFGPTLLLTVVSNLQLGTSPIQRLADLNSIPSHARTQARSGTWVPESWSDPQRVERLAIDVSAAGERRKRGDADWERHLALPFVHIRPDERAAYMVSVPTALAGPGILAAIWTWAERYVGAVVRHSNSDLN